MKYETIPARLKRLVNLSQFAAESGISRRTLERLKSEGVMTSNLGTLNKVVSALESLRPKMRKA